MTEIMDMTLHEWAHELLTMPDKPFTFSIDISTGDEDAYDRVFVDDFLGINNMNTKEIILLFSSKINIENKLQNKNI